MSIKVSMNSSCKEEDYVGKRFVEFQPHYHNTIGHYFTPFVCPVCGGRGVVSRGFYDWLTASTTDAMPETCRSCQGTGIVWK